MNLNCGPRPRCWLWSREIDVSSEHVTLVEHGPELAVGFVQFADGLGGYLADGLQVLGKLREVACAGCDMMRPGLLPTAVGLFGTSLLR